MLRHDTMVKPYINRGYRAQLLSLMYVDFQYDFRTERLFLFEAKYTAQRNVCKMFLLLSALYAKFQKQIQPNAERFLQHGAQDHIGAGAVRTVAPGVRPCRIWKQCARVASGCAVEVVRKCFVDKEEQDGVYHDLLNPI